MFRRPFPRPLRRSPTGDDPIVLRRAYQLMAAGQYAEAAEIFERFAREAVSSNRPRAPWSLLEAGRARIIAGQVKEGMAHIQEGLSLFATRGQLQKFLKNGMRIIEELNSRGLTAEAKQIKDLIEATLPNGLAAGLGISEKKSKLTLPTNCPGCGGSIRSDEVEWIDNATAECPYCGSAVRAE